MILSDPLQLVPGVGPANAKRLVYLGLERVEDLVNHYPFRYEDFSLITKVIDAQFGMNVTLRGEIWSIKNTYTRFGKVLTKAVLNDGSGPIEIVWFNQSWLSKTIKPGDKLQISGKVGKMGSKLSITAPEWEKIAENGEGLHTGRLVPVYPETAGLTSKWLRQKLATILPRVSPFIMDPLPLSIRGEMLPLAEAIHKIHFPGNWSEVGLAKERLSFDELFFIQLATLKKRREWEEKKTTQSLKIDKERLEEFIKWLPFELTNAQKRVIDEIVEDLKSSTPMNRLIQGEVGSGKTVVAAVIIYLTYLNGLKSFLMAPTEILAFQHFETLKRLLEPKGIEVGLYTGSKKFTNNTQSDPDVIVGTHALLSDKLSTENVGLVIVDEQQRFGVAQRTLLRAKAKLPHFLAMTATPIPRTVALTIYGDLDVSVINELPKGRTRVKTYYTPSYKRNDAYEFIAKKIKVGDQVYIITPLIEESETLATAKAAKVEFERLQKEVFPQFKLGLLHGKLKSKEKEQVINDFKEKNIDILVSTSVVEVGVDVPNATIMVIEGAERFGLAQLHQLRGRVGRGSKESYCLLFSESEEPNIVTRLKNLERIYDGLELSELDLQIRGGGDIFGVRQSGRWDLKIASLSNLELIEKTRSAAKKILEDNPNLDKYPLIQAKLQSLSQVDVLPD